MLISCELHAAWRVPHPSQVSVLSEGDMEEQRKKILGRVKPVLRPTKGQ
jgi:hypothetical protein